MRLQQRPILASRYPARVARQVPAQPGVAPVNPVMQQAQSMQAMYSKPQQGYGTAAPQLPPTVTPGPANDVIAKPAIQPYAKPAIDPYSKPVMKPVVKPAVPGLTPVAPQPMTGGAYTGMRFPRKNAY